MLTHVHKVKHLVVGTFEQGLETSPVECSPVERGQSDGATGALYRKDRFSQSAPDADHVVTRRWVLRSVSGSSEDTGVGLRPDAGSLCDRTLAGASGPADVVAHRGDRV